MRRPLPFRRISSPEEREARIAELREQEIQLKSPDMVGMSNGRTVWSSNPAMSANHSGIATQKYARLRKELDQENELIEKHKKLLKQIKLREERLSAQMVPRKEFFAKKEDTSEYHKTVDHIVKVEQSPAYQREALELQNLYRARSALDAKLHGSRENPECADLGHLRK